MTEPAGVPVVTVVIPGYDRRSYDEVKRWARGHEIASLKTCDQKTWEHLGDELFKGPNGEAALRQLATDNGIEQIRYYDE